MNTSLFGFAAQSLLDELEASCLEVILIPQRVFTNVGGCVRCAVQKNARWYRDFCAAYPSNRKTPRRRAQVDTLIKRALTIKALRSMAGSGRAVEGVYARRLAPLCECRAHVLKAAYASLGETNVNPF